MKKRKLLADTIAVLIAFVVIRECLGFLTSDFAMSLIPAWHASLYAKNELLIIATIILLFATYLIFKLVVFLRRIALKGLERLGENIINSR